MSRRTRAPGPSACARSRDRPPSDRRCAAVVTSIDASTTAAPDKPSLEAIVHPGACRAVRASGWRAVRRADGARDGRRRPRGRRRSRWRAMPRRRPAWLRAATGDATRCDEGGRRRPRAATAGAADADASSAPTEPHARATSAIAPPTTRRPPPTARCRPPSSMDASAAPSTADPSVCPVGDVVGSGVGSCSGRRSTSACVTAVTSRCPVGAPVGSAFERMIAGVPSRAPRRP